MLGALSDLNLGWLAGAAIGVAGVAVGSFLLRVLVKHHAPWWRSVAAPLVLFGPAIGILVGSAIAGGPLIFGAGAHRAMVNIAWSILIFFGATAVFGIVRAFLQSRVMTEELGIRIPTLLLDAGRWILWAVMIFVVVSVVWGRTDWLTALFTASAIGTVIIGLALQETLANLFAGIALVTENIYGIGDWVWIGEEEGEVVEISRRTTKLRTRSGDILTLANRTIATSRIRNMAHPTKLHAEFIYVPAPFDVAPNRVRQVLREALKDAPGVLDTPAPILRIFKYGDSGIDYQLKIFMSDLGAIPDIKSEALVQIWYHFARAGIEFPFPVREVRRLPTPMRPDAQEASRAVLARLRTVPLFQTLPDDVVEVLAHDARVHDFGAAERVVRQGQAGYTCYVVDSGSVEVTVGDGAASRRVATLKAGDLFGEMSLLTGEPRSATVRTVGDARLIQVGAESLREALQRSPELAQRLAEAVAARKEGLVGALTAADAETQARVDDGTKRLRHLIRRFFKIGDGSDGP